MLVYVRAFVWTYECLHVCVDDDELSLLCVQRKLDEVSGRDGMGNEHTDARHRNNVGVIHCQKAKTLKKYWSAT